MNKEIFIKSQIDENQKLRKFFNKIFLNNKNRDYLLKEGIAKKIEVAVDTIDDTLCGIDDYISMEQQSSYLFLYGIFQLLYCQQDALYYLECAVKNIIPEKKIPSSFFTSNEKIIRYKRNLLVGHPQQSYGNKSGQVTRITLDKYKLIISETEIDNPNNINWINISMLDLITLQLNETKNKLIRIQNIISSNKELDLNNISI